MLAGHFFERKKGNLVFGKLISTGYFQVKRKPISKILFPLSNAAKSNENHMNVFVFD